MGQREHQPDCHPPGLYWSVHLQLDAKVPFYGTYSPKVQLVQRRETPFRRLPSSDSAALPSKDCQEPVGIVRDQAVRTQLD